MAGRVCSVPACHRSVLSDDLCLIHFATEYGPLGLDDMPPRWAIEEEPMTALTTAPAFVCEGWYDANDQHHVCTTPNPAHQSKGRCGRCYSREYAANQKVRPPQSERPALTVVPAPRCVGWDGSDGTHHGCRFPDDDLLDNRGRCQKCARMQHGADVAREMAPPPAPPASTPAPTPATPVTRPPSELPTYSKVPVLRPRHVRPVVSFAIVCANCDGPLIQGDQQTIVGYVGHTLTCRDCGAAWQVDASTLAQPDQSEATAA